MSSEVTLPSRSRPPLVAAPWHTAVLLLGFGYFSVRMALTNGNTQSALSSTAPTRSAQILHYAFMIAFEFAPALWVWAGVQWQGGKFRELIGGRWTSWNKVALDIVVAFFFWLVWEAAAWLLLRMVEPLHAPVSEYHVPAGFTEIFLWILLSLAAGFSEELVFRGYLQRQFHAATGSIVAAVILQGVAFGLAHTYQGWGRVIVISGLGILYGVLAARRGNLRANMLAHAWSDIFEGYLRFL
jgi:membrane protease YdiL (CAAX protease family)